jgi:CheY-like chemotaxis protein
MELPVGGKLKAGTAPAAEARTIVAGAPAPKEQPPGAVPGSAFGQSTPTARLDSAAVLVVEDETALASAMVETLADAGYLVDRAGNGEEAIACLNGGHYDLIISDLKMPRMDGVQLFASLRESYPEMTSRILFVTGDVIGTDAERFLAESGCRWLAKPFRLNELLRIARDVLAAS